jgi:hypothetical protein
VGRLYTDNGGAYLFHVWTDPMPPGPSFGFAASEPDPLDIRFSETSYDRDRPYGKLVSWQRNFGDGTTDNTPAQAYDPSDPQTDDVREFVHHFPAAGTYHVSLDAVDDDGLVGRWEADVPVVGPCCAVGSGIQIKLDAQPNAAQDFDFLGDMGLFSLDADADGTLPNQKTFGVPPGTYRVEVSSADGWSLQSITCTDPDGGTTADVASRRLTIDFVPGETVICTFVGWPGGAEVGADGRGNYTDQGDHASDDPSYLTGRDAAGPDRRTRRSFFVFDVPTDGDLVVVRAELEAHNPVGGYQSPDSSETLTLYEVTTPIADLEAGGTGHTAIFDDLGDGSI